ncbi:hypothetical protein HY409_00010 [Candidatus Gottesmanbacteria bacterium]|nr:hypothetical protein [Candidatus Gottesmanbacteria bacterium]
MTKFTKTIVLTFFSCILLLTPAVAIAGTTPTVVVEKNNTVKTVDPIASPTATIVKKDEYLLPYPGILPDHPLYFLKGLRDRILEGLIVDPLRKAEFYILQADKRLNMGMFLEGQGKRVLMEQVISKGEKYMEKAVSGLTFMKSTGAQVPAYIIDRLEKSMAKHIEELDALRMKVDEAQKAGLTASLDLVKKLQGEVGKLK